MKVTVQGVLPEGLIPFQLYQVYNCLDSAITAQLVPEMKELLNENTAKTYDREMRLVGLCLSMSTTGFPVGQWELINLVRDLQLEQERAQYVLEKCCEAVGVPAFNPNSPLQVATFFYGTMGIPEIRRFDFKQKKSVVDTSREALEKIFHGYPSAKPFTNAVIAYKETTKLLGVFKRGLESGSRLRCSFSPTGTDTGRLSSSQNVYGRGTNAQNLTDRARRVVVARPNMVLTYHDLKTAESIAVGFLSACKAYIEGCLLGDLHTYVSRLVWPELPWNGDLAKDKEIAEKLKFYRDFSYRDTSKRLGHATNYYGSPPQIGRVLKMEQKAVASFQDKYFTAFPEIPNWQVGVIATIQRTRKLVSPLGRERQFWGHPSDPATHRTAIAHGPQGLVADVMNEGLLQVMPWLREASPSSELLAQVHDAGLFHHPKALGDKLTEELNERLVFPVDFGSLGTMRIPVDAQYGFSWGKQKARVFQPNGLRNWHPDAITSAKRL